MGRPKKNQENTEVAEKPAKVVEAPPPIDELLNLVPLEDLDIVGPKVQDISMGMRPAILTEDNLKNEKSDNMPANPIISLTNSSTSMFEGVLKEVVESLANLKKEMVSVKDYTKQIGTSNVQVPPDLTMFKSWQDMANKKFVEISNKVDDLSSKLDPLNKSLEVLQASVSSLTATVLDFLDAYNQTKVTHAIETGGAMSGRIPSKLPEPPFAGPYKEVASVAPVQEEEEDIIEAEVEVLSPEEELLRKYPAIAQGRKQNLSNADVNLPKKIINTIKKSPHICSPKTWSKNFSPQIEAKYPGVVTENDIFTFLIKLNALDEHGNLDPNKLPSL